MPSIILTTLNARHIHCAFGLRYLMANLGELQKDALLLEFGIKQRPMDIVEALLAQNPKIVAMGIYIWNTEPSLKVVQLLRAVAPEIKIVLGGPEVSYETESQEITTLADVVVSGEADLVFPSVCAQLLAGTPVPHLVTAPPPAMDLVLLPYDLYSDYDLAHRITYVEASRGCPYTCEFCLSSLDIPVRRPELEPFLAAMDDLLARGAQHFKFVDRTFNLNLKLTSAILNFFKARYRSGLFLHFEMVPDRLPEPLRELISQFPAGALQFEVGIQTFDPLVAERVSLRRDHSKTEDNLGFLQRETGVHVHADLIVGLPGEDLASFGRGFNRLLGLGPHEIQVGILKRLRGTPIMRHDDPFAMVYSPFPPYEILKNSCLSHQELQQMRRFSQVWDRIANSGRFNQSIKYLLDVPSPFDQVLAFSDWLGQNTESVHEIGLDRLGKLLLTYLSEELGYPSEQIRAALASDLKNLGRHEPGWLKTQPAKEPGDMVSQASNTKRQQRHLA